MNLNEKTRFRFARDNKLSYSEISCVISIGRIKNLILGILISTNPKKTQKLRYVFYIKRNTT
jgi:hypothetical protein